MKEIRDFSETNTPPIHVSEECYKLFSELLSDYLFIVDIEPNGKLKLSWTSNNLGLLTGRSISEAETEDQWNSIINPDDIENFSNFIKKVISSHEKAEFECRTFHKDGRERWIRIVAQLKGPAVGSVRQILGAIREITVQKQTEQQLLQSEQKYRLLHSSMTDAFCATNMNGEMLEFNESFRQMLGYSEEELMKLTYKDFTPTKWHEMEAKIVEEEIIPFGHSPVYEKEYYKKDGTFFPIEIRTFLIRDEKGAPSKMWAIVRDITNRKKTQKRLHETLADKEALLREVHHRVSNNLQTVLSLINTRSPEVHDSASKVILNELQEQIRTIHIIYNEMFKVNRSSVINMQNYFQTLTYYLVKIFKLSNLEIKIDCGNLEMEAKQATLCGLIINELATNALKYAFPERFTGTPCISIHLKKKKGGLSLELSDNGVGLPDNVNIIEPETIGLQLINIWVIYQLKGKLTVKTTKGTSYTLTFPFHDNEQSRDPI
ncbi:MAG: PAS domain S-box protein [Bacteroidota bacterium]